MTKRRSPEHELQKLVCWHLRMRAKPNIYFTAIPNGGLRSKATAARLKAEGVRAGNPDLLLIINGHACGLELKAGKGRATESQELAAADWAQAGGTYMFANGLDEALAILEAIGAIEPSEEFIGVRSAAA